MPDLHGWITQQITIREEAAAAAAQDGTPDWRTKTHFRVADGNGDPVVYDEGRPTEDQARHIALHDPAAVLRRCTADRKILARHTLNPDVHYEPACKGCGTYGDMELSETENLNECPELLDLAEGYGLTPEILTTLDQPETPARPERPDIPPPVHLNAIVRLLSARPTSSVPPALRGPNWKATP